MAGPVDRRGRPGLPENEVTMDRDELLEREHASWSTLEAAVGRVPAGAPFKTPSVHLLSMSDLASRGSIALR
jgi:hypothetical protein